MSYGSHYRVEGEEAGGSHVTYDSGVAELKACRGSNESGNGNGFVDLARVGTLKDILVLDYARIHVVLMKVSWVAPHTDLQPRLRRDGHGFWLANMAATPRCLNDPYILPSLASQVQNLKLSNTPAHLDLEVSPEHGSGSIMAQTCAGIFRPRQGRAWMECCVAEGGKGAANKLEWGGAIPRPGGV